MARYVLMGVAGGVALVLIIVLIGVAVRHQPASTSATASGGEAPAGTSSGPVGHAQDEPRRDRHAGTNFSDGDFDLDPGQSVIGYVSYELPSSAKIASVAWDADLQGTGVVTWTV